MKPRKTTDRSSIECDCDPGLVPVWIPMVIALRAYTKPVPRDDEREVRPAKGKRKTRKALPTPSDWTVVFDTETQTDHIQNLRIGTYQVRNGEALHEAGVFCEPANLSAGDLSVLKTYAADRGLKVRTREESVREVLYEVGLHRGGLILGFNLPFDLARLAIASTTSHAKDMRDGFTLTLLPEKRHPHLLVKHLNSRTAFMRFAQPPKPVDGRGMRKRFRTQAPTGYFQDVKTIGTALLGLRSISLASLTDLLQTEHRKKETEEHGGPLTSEYLDYAVNDTQATWECYAKLKAMYEGHGLTDTPPHRIYSEAALGKAYFRQMGIQPWGKVQADFPPEITGAIMTAYYGGRSEVRIRRQMTRVFACDFRSMYPTVCTLMGLWPFVIATGIHHEDWTNEARMLLARVGLADLQRQNLWPFLTTLVQVEADADIFPVRGPYGSGTSRTIGLNYLKADTRLWYTLADCIGSKLLTGKAPKIVRAIRFTPKATQPDLKPIDIAGNPDFHIDPYADDLFKRVIELRGKVQAEEKQALADGRADVAERLKAFQEMLKLLANSTSYGIFAEINVQSYDRPRDVTCYGLNDAYVVGTKAIEEPGTSFHPLLATLITGAARLMLAIAETVADQNGLGWAFCDTDSMALACPEGLSEDAFLARARAVTEWFDPLNPYDDGKPLFKIEDENFAIKNGKVQKGKYEPLYVFAVSSKRYALFNLDCDHKPVIRKASAHGLGHLIAPYREDEAPASIPPPSISLKEIGVERWQYDVWYQIVMAELEGHPDQIDLSPLPHLDRAAASRYSAATPELLHWFDPFNEGKSFAKRMKPFNFMLAFQISRPALLKFIAQGKLDARLCDGDTPSAMAAFDKNTERAAKRCFDRNTGLPVPRAILASYREVIATYHLHSESKFENGQLTDRGVTRRRYIHAIAVDHIGKEANKWEEQFYLGELPETQVVYDQSSSDYDRMVAIIADAATEFTQVALADAAGITRQDLAAIISGTSRARARTMRVLCEAVARGRINRYVQGD